MQRITEYFPIRHRTTGYSTSRSTILATTGMSTCLSQPSTKPAYIDLFQRCLFSPPQGSGTPAYASPAYRHTDSSDNQSQALTTMTQAVRCGLDGWDHSHLRYSQRLGLGTLTIEDIITTDSVLSSGKVVHYCAGSGTVNLEGDACPCAVPLPIHTYIHLHNL